MLKKYSHLLLFVLLWSACSKESFPPDGAEEPVFVAQFQIAQDAYSLSAGKDSLYLFTKHQYDPDTANVVICSGAFAAVDCPGAYCPGSLTFEFRNTIEGAEVFFDTAFAVGPRPYLYVGTPIGDTLKRIRFFTSDTLDYVSFQWLIDGGSPVTGRSITKEYTDNNPHQVTLRALRNGAIGSIVSRTIVPDILNETYPAVNITVTDSVQAGSYVLIANTLGTAVESFAWNTGDSTQQIEVSQLDANYAVTVKNTAGDTAYAVIAAVNAITPIVSSANFEFTVENVLPPSDPLQLGSVLIRWVDENNTVWESRRGAQPASSFFQILSSENYELNENGQKTRKMEVAFSCIMFNINNLSESRPISGTAVIAVAHP